MTSNAEACPAYLSYQALYNPCEPETWLIKGAKISLGLAGVIVFPTLVVGTLTNILLIMVLATYVVRPRQLENWAIASAIIDIVYVQIEGLWFTVTVDVRLWWGIQKKFIGLGSHMACRLSQFIAELLKAMRLNFMFFLVLHDLTRERRQDYIAKGMRLALSLIVAFIISVIQSVPSYVVHGVFQIFGIFVCAVDPIWAKEYVSYNRMHEQVCVELLPSLFITALCYLVNTRLKNDKVLLAYMERQPSSENLISLVLKSLKMRKLDSYLNHKVVLIHVLPTCAIRIIQVFILTVIQLDKDDSAAEFSARLSLMKLSIYAELITASLSFLVWLYYIPEVKFTLIQLWRLLSCRSHVEFKGVTKKSDINRYFNQAVSSLPGLYAHLRLRQMEVERMRSIRNELKKKFQQNEPELYESEAELDEDETDNFDNQQISSENEERISNISSLPLSNGI